uniref:Uncharacterized protein n=1 Tax=Cricetulus griseus TaxID=10029 RepID=A0A8C2LVS6_CRIGR
FEVRIAGRLTQRPSVLFARGVHRTPARARSGAEGPRLAPPLRHRPAEAAGLLTDRVHAVCEQQSPRATASRGGGRLGPRVPPSDHYHIKARFARSRAVAAEATQRQAFAERRRGPAATVSEKEHC